MLYLDLLATLDTWFAAGVSAEPGGLVPCRAGCTACCHGPFDISAADARMVSEAVAALPSEIARGIRERAGEQLASGAAIDPRWQRPWRPTDLGDDGFDALCDAQAHLPCPALDPGSGACLIHASRPATCRITGLSMLTAEGDVLENVCPIQDRFAGYGEMEATPFDLMRFELEAAEHDLEALAQGWHSTTVAGAA
ncbi:MAG TPA: YkgJ family cysteine cluster protein [Gemmatimonadales bacterium]|nr:YkgJ family cysteine cluster protein [Gemmatimonadales bacterium]